MPYTNQYSPAVFPFHFDGVFSTDPGDDQFGNPENFHGGPEDQFFLPMTPGITYRIVLTPCDQVGVFPFPDLPNGRTNLILWHDLVNYYRYGEVTGTTLDTYGLTPDPWPTGLALIDAPPQVGMVWTVGAPEDENGSTAVDALTRLSVNGRLNPSHFPTYSLDISVVGGPAARYRVLP